MTNDRRLLIGTIGLLYVFVAATWLGWRSFHKFNDCENRARDISGIAKGQDILLYSIFLLSEVMKPEKRQLSKRVLESGEQPLKKAIEGYAESCRLKAEQIRLAFMIRGYELYLMNKRNIFKTTEAAGMDWVRKTMPIDAVLRGQDD